MGLGGPWKAFLWLAFFCAQSRFLRWISSGSCVSHGVRSITVSESREKQRHAPIWPWVLTTVVLLMLYWFSVGPFVHWRQSAKTRQEYYARNSLAARIYAPIFWVLQNDPTHLTYKAYCWTIQPWAKPGFDWIALPGE